ncbi:hypothetical protein [Clostridium thermobutyricum]|uniref:hypothetical protein n=1 Tax=Clostridium thermobutyricum TaxID=29372 RepID=UPI0018ABD596|nr:hypothetical protein [Clostridium thermobutyricum]
MSEELKELKIGDKVFWNDEKEGLIIKARNERYLIAANEEEYSIIDLKEGICSTNDYVFNPYDYKNQDDIDKSLSDLENGKYGLSRRNKSEISKVIVNYERS